MPQELLKTPQDTPRAASDGPRHLQGRPKRRARGLDPPRSLQDRNLGSFAALLAEKLSPKIAPSAAQEAWTRPDRLKIASWVHLLPFGRPSWVRFGLKRVLVFSVHETHAFSLNGTNSNPAQRPQDFRLPPQELPKGNGDAEIANSDQDR